MPPVAELWGRVGRAAKRPIKVAGELGAVAHYRNEIESVLIQLRANSRHATIHHVARADAIGAGLSKCERRCCEFFQRRRMIDARAIQHRAMTVSCVSAQTSVHPETKTRSKLLLNL